MDAVTIQAVHNPLIEKKLDLHPVKRMYLAV